jgi:photosystem II stability/assembly factor-like uncharacterized protein
MMPLSFTSSDGGHNWTLSVTLPPTQSDKDHFLTSVACDDSNQVCTAVGHYNTGSQYIPLAYITANGGQSWQRATILPAVPNASSGFLNSVACSSSGSVCIAVGYYNNGGQFVPLSYTSQDGGNTWSISSTLPTPQGLGINALNSVTCASDGLHCVTVGRYSSGGRAVPLSFTSSDAGNNWIISDTLPTAQGAGDNMLLAVACDRAGQQCVVVGDYNNGGEIIPLSFISGDGGKNWVRSITQPPAQGVFENELSSLACDNQAQHCTAIGDYTYQGREVPSSYITTDGGKNWTVSSTQPPAKGTGDNEATSVS